jgi:hypothetical protein
MTEAGKDQGLYRSIFEQAGGCKVATLPSWAPSLVRHIVELKRHFIKR